MGILAGKCRCSRGVLGWQDILADENAIRFNKRVRDVNWILQTDMLVVSCHAWLMSMEAKYCSLHIDFRIRTSSHAIMVFSRKI